MTKPRLTITLDDEVLHKIRSIQSKLIEKTKKNWSFSGTLSLVLSIGLGAKELDELIDTVIENKIMVKQK